MTTFTHSALTAILFTVTVVAFTSNSGWAKDPGPWQREVAEANVWCSAESISKNTMSSPNKVFPTPFESRFLTSSEPPAVEVLFNKIAEAPSPLTAPELLALGPDVVDIAARASDAWRSKCQRVFMLINGISNDKSTIRAFDKQTGWGPPVSTFHDAIQKLVYFRDTVDGSGLSMTTAEPLVAIPMAHARFMSLYDAAIKTTDSSHIEEMRSTLLKMWMYRRLTLNAIIFAWSFTDSLRISAGWEDLKYMKMPLLDHDRRTFHFVTEDQARFDDLPSKMAEALVNNRNAQERAALCSGDVGGVSMVNEALNCASVRGINSKARSRDIQLSWNHCQSLNETGIKVLEDAISASCFKATTELNTIQAVVNSWRGSDPNLGAKFSGVSSSLAAASKNEQTCTKLAEPLLRKAPLLAWKRCMSQLDLSSTARRYAVTDSDIYTDYMTKGASSCAENSGIANLIAGYFKGCTYAWSGNIEWFATYEDGYPDEGYESDAGTIDVYDVVIKSRKLSEPE